MATILGTKVKDAFAILSLLGLLAVGAPISTVKAEKLPESAVQTVAFPSAPLGLTVSKTLHS